MGEQPWGETEFRTAGGIVRGRRSPDGITAVLGIPYAAAPFGAHRFRPPRPAARWSGSRDCTVFGPVAPQSAELPGAPVWRPGDEEVLTANVWAPPPSEAGPLPVLFWIHGGAYTFGSSAQPDFDGTALARAGVVVVSCNYRVGFEGFGHVPGFPDNRGLLDQVAALRWVRENIAAFGGDPGNVTVAGHSAGAGSAACLMVMEQARGLFRRAVAHSVPHGFFGVEVAAAITSRIAAEAGVPATGAGLLSASPQALVAASDKVAERCGDDPVAAVQAFDPVVFQPVLDGEVLPVDPLAALASGRAREVDLLVCHTLEEYWFLHEVGAVREVASEPGLADFAEALSLPGRLVDGYRALMPDAPAQDRYLAIFGDAVFGEYSSRLAEHHARAGGRAYLARFARRRPRPGGGARPWHTADIPFAFGNLDAAGADFLIGGAPDAQDRALSRRMLRAWADFAACGDPGWPAVTADVTTVRVWAVPDDHLSDDAASAVRALWRGVPLEAAPDPEPVPAPVPVPAPGLTELTTTSSPSDTFPPRRTSK
ncbi:carboxylesterase family protein [Streptomyces sp. Root1310]|uniref:carboxylesterase/lipase family protein n=1 Tax=Streptomyces sp. Root1310 TaxID=1736452 RepID=UPI0007106AEF|nr:carboxylesterase family protein [Streptomyces sp. Root1310]KQX62283.1 carboxylesterase [Streptomyces sp. Root1310]